MRPLPAPVEKVLAVVDTLFVQEGRSDPFLKALVSGLALNHQGIACTIEAADLAYDDDDLDGRRAFAYNLGGVVYDRAGNRGWDAILRATAEGSAADKGRAWHRVISQSSKDIVDGELSSAKDIIEVSARLAGLAYTTLQANLLDAQTPTPSLTQSRRMGL